MLFEHDEGRKNLKLIEAGLKEKDMKYYYGIIKSFEGKK